MSQPIDNFISYYDAALSAIDHLDTGDAFRALKNFEVILQTLPTEETADPEFRKNMDELHRQLRYIAFPDLPQEEVQKILSSELVSFVMSGIDLEERLSVRNIFTEYGERNNNRQMMKQAILSNTEVIGGVTLQEWIQLFDQMFDSKTREDRTVLDFLTRNPKFVELSKTEQQILKIILIAYEHWMATPRFDIIDLAYLDQNIDKLQTGSARSGIYENPVANEALERAEESRSRLSETNKNQSRIPNESLPLLKALGKFEKLGGQQVTNSKIVVKGQNDPVRPTIFNWLRAYRDELGVGAHDSVTRGQFLFHSLNGKGLSSDERDQVGMLLKSIDENSPLTIDAGRQEVVFQKQIPNIKYQIPNPPAVRQLADPIAAQPLPMQNGGNISRAVFELPHVSQQITRNREQGTVNKQQITENREQGTENREQRTGSKEQGTGNREQGTGSREQEIKNSGLRQPAESAVRDQVTPAPRTVSFEPAKIDNFSFGAGRGSDLQGIENSGLTAPKAERPMFANEGNVSAVSFSTNHVMPAEKERISEQGTGSREQGAGSREQEIPNTIRQLTDQIPNAERPLPIPTAGASIKNETTAQPAPVKQAPAPPPVNRFRITPTGHRDTVASDDTPSPHVVDLRS